VSPGRCCSLPSTRHCGTDHASSTSRHEPVTAQLPRRHASPPPCSPTRQALRSQPIPDGVDSRVPPGARHRVPSHVTWVRPRTPGQRDPGLPSLTSQVHGGPARSTDAHAPRSPRTSLTRVTSRWDAGQGDDARPMEPRPGGAPSTCRWSASPSLPGEHGRRHERAVLVSRRHTRRVPVLADPGRTEPLDTPGRANAERRCSHDTSRDNGSFRPTRHSRPRLRSPGLARSTRQGTRALPRARRHTTSPPSPTCRLARATKRPPGR
jgi:hypothetical protein